MLFPGRDESVLSHPGYYFLGELMDFSTSECHCFGLLSWLCYSTGLAFPLVQKWADLPARAVRTRQETMPSFTQGEGEEMCRCHSCPVSSSPYTCMTFYCDTRCEIAQMHCLCYFSTFYLLCGGLAMQDSQV